VNPKRRCELCNARPLPDGSVEFPLRLELSPTDMRPLRAQLRERTQGAVGVDEQRHIYTMGNGARAPFATSSFAHFVHQDIK